MNYKFYLRREARVYIYILLYFLLVLMIGQSNKGVDGYICDHNLLIVYKNGYGFGAPQVVMVNSFFNDMYLSILSLYNWKAIRLEFSNSKLIKNNNNKIIKFKEQKVDLILGYIQFFFR